MKPFISIIIPTYNRAHLILETLDSILLQSYKNWECIIVDDGSTDNTAEIVFKHLQKDNRFQYHTRPKERKKGPNSCRNYGFELSKGELIQFFDSDDIMKPNCLEKKASLFSESIDLVICKLSLYDFEKKLEIKQSNIIADNLLLDYFSGKVALYISGPIWSRHFLEKRTFLFDEGIINCDDWDFNMNMLYFNPNYIVYDEALIIYRKHSDSLSKLIEEKYFEEIKNVSNLLDKHLALLKNNKTKELKSFYKYAIEYNKRYLKEAILQKDKIQYFLLLRISRYCITSHFWVIFFNIWTIKILHLFFGKIYYLFKRAKLLK